MAHYYRNGNAISRAGVRDYFLHRANLHGVMADKAAIDGFVEWFCVTHSGKSLPRSGTAAHVNAFVDRHLMKLGLIPRPTMRRHEGLGRIWDYHTC